MRKITSLTLSIIVPVYNEEKTIQEILKRVKSVKLPKNITKEIIVVDDGSTDATSNFLKKLSNVKYIKHPKNLGKGAAIRTGLKKSSGDLIVIQDGDLEYDPIYYIKLLDPVLNNNAQVVFGTRLKNYPLNLFGNHKTVLPTHLLANKFLTLLTNIFYRSKLTDMETCYKLFKKDVLADIKLESDRFNFEPEITAKILKKGIKIVEVPIKAKPRSYKEGKKINWKDGMQAIWTIIKYRFID